MPDLMMWVFAVLIVLAMGVLAMVAAGRGEPMEPAYDDRPDAVVPADRPLAARDLRRVRFSLAFRGYRMSEVDALLSRLAAEMEAAPSGAEPASDRAAGPSVAAPRDVPGSSPVDLASAGAVAKEWAAAFGPVAGGPLDFTPDSVAHVEGLLAEWASDRAEGDVEDNPSVWGAGAYVGEVLRRAVPGAEWAQHRVFGPVPVVQMPTGRLEDPIGRAMTRYETGPEESIASFARAALAAVRRAPGTASDVGATDR